MHFRLIEKYTLAIGAVVLAAMGLFALLNGRTLRATSWKRRCGTANFSAKP